VIDVDGGTVREVMTKDVVTVHEGTTIRQVARLLAQHEITALPALSYYGELVGVVTGADVLGMCLRSAR
jgi:CBS-domain-containing membrane protein